MPLIFCRKRKRGKKDMNKCMFTGRLVRNPEAKVRRRKKDDSKFLVVTFTLAIGDDDDTDYLCFKIMNASAETFNQYVKKGMKVIISDARAKYEKYTVDGEEKEKVVFNVYQWEFAETKRKSSVSEDEDYNLKKVKLPVCRKRYCGMASRKRRGLFYTSRVCLKSI